jgi:hypothetical protein
MEISFQDLGNALIFTLGENMVQCLKSGIWKSII